MPSAVWQQHQDAMTQNAMGPQRANHPFMSDTSLQQHWQPNESFHSGPSMSMDLSGQYDPIGGCDGQLDLSMDAGMQDEAAPDGRRKKGSASSAANDVELRRLFRENKQKSLPEVAAQVMKDDKGPKSEKTKQIFGMIW